MDADLNEALDEIKQLRAAIILAFSDGSEDPETKMPEDLREAFHDAAKVLAKHGQPDELMRLDYYKITGEDSEL